MKTTHRWAISLIISVALLLILVEILQHISPKGSEPVEASRDSVVTTRSEIGSAVVAELREGEKSAESDGTSQAETQGPDESPSLAWEESPVDFHSLKAKYIAKLKQGQRIDQYQFTTSVLSERYYATDILYKSPERRLLIVRELRTSPSDPLPLTEIVVEADSFLLTTKRDLTADESARIRQTYGLHSLQHLGAKGQYLVTLTVNDLAQRTSARQDLERHPLVDLVESNSLYFASKVPKDTYFDRQWGLQNSGAIGNDANLTNMIMPKKGNDIAAALAWDEATDCSGLSIAVLDTGIDPNHPDLSANVDTALSRNFVGNAPNAYLDLQGHGTHVSGIIGAMGDNSLGIAGVCWKAKILGVRVLDANGAGTEASIIGGLNYTAQSTAKIVNMSLGGGGASQAFANAITAVANAGKLLVIAAGNENANNDTVPAFPANFPNPEIISVAALAANGTITNFSNFGLNNVDIAAPGELIASLAPVAMAPPNTNPSVSAYQYSSGTSQATPYVAGAAALLWSSAPKLTALQVKDLLLKTSPKGAYTNKIVGKGVQLSLPALMDSIKTIGRLRGVSAGDQIVALNSSDIKVPIEIIPGYAAAAKVELISGNDVLASGTGATISELSLPFNPKRTQLDVSVRVTDADGRVSISSPLKIKAGAEKFLDFSQLELQAKAGDVDCELQKLGEDDTKTNILSKSVDSVATCKSLCSFVGPLSYSSLNEIRCGSGSEIYYRKSIEN